jgi:hypothetical protein
LIPGFGNPRRAGSIYRRKPRHRDSASEKEPAMGKLLRCFTSFLLAAVISLPLFCSGCAAHVSVYDPYYHDRHVWAAEEPYYTQWEVSTHREHVDFAKRSPAEQKEYWDYRHSQH